MKILSFSCKNVHGYLSFKIDFDESLTFLTGINGSGKTTAVRLIVSLLTPSITNLANTSYKLLSVTVVDKDELITIESEKKEGHILVRCSNAEGELRFPILRTGAYESGIRFIEKEHDFYREQESIFSNHPVLTAIESLPTPMFLDLERKYQQDIRRRGEEIYRKERANPLAGSIVDSIGHAQRLAENAYRHSLTRRSQLTDILKQSIILAAFELGDNNSEDAMNLTPSWTAENLREIERVVIQSLRQIGILDERIGTVILPFFAKVKEVVESYPSGDEIKIFLSKSSAFDNESYERINAWSVIRPQVRQIYRLRELIVRYNEQVAKAFEPIERYRSSINKFLEDSNKNINFSPEGNLRVRINGHDSSKPIDALSSGERQLVVILTHLAFNQASRTKVLIIDEPELSLHLRWQELFVNAVIGASPNLQLILATHSPAIIKSHISNCVDVEEAHIG